MAKKSRKALVEGESRTRSLVPVAAPWERQPTDTDETWMLFQAYRDSRPRRLLSIGGDLNKAVRLYSEGNWQKRCEHYDRYLDALRMYEIEEAHRQTAREIAAEHMKFLSTFRELLMRETQKLLADSKACEMSGLMKPGDLIRMADTVVKLDRLLRDQSTENIAHAVQDLSQLSTDELLQLERLQQKITKTDGRG